MKQDISLFALSKKGAELCSKIQSEFGGQFVGLVSRVENADQKTDDIGKALVSAFGQGRAIVAIMAAGALIRILAPHLSDKKSEPPVIAISEDGSAIIPLLGGHHGGNRLAQKLADFLDGQAAITTAGETRFGIALDEPPAGYALGNSHNAKAVMAALLDGARAELTGEACQSANWLKNSQLPMAGKDEAATVRLQVTEQRIENPGALELVFHPKSLVLGLGCERGADPEEVIALAEKTLTSQNLAPQSLAAIASIDLKQDEAAIHAAATHFGVESRFFSAEELEAEAKRLKHPSEIVFAETGCHGVAEGAALALAGKKAELLVPKQKSKRATAAIARASEPVDIDAAGRRRGRLFVLGIGPGQAGWRSPEVNEMVKMSDDLVGYSLYLDLIDDISLGKTRHDFGLGDEEKRVRHALELAETGKNVALVCSGDAGIYAMASLVFELVEKGGLSAAAKRAEIIVSPGISALQAAAARAGAPLGHDFCTISLSDLLTPWATIEARIEAAAKGDFVIAFYNPVSKRRRTQLAKAREILLGVRPAKTPVVLAANLGRQSETIRFVTLEGLNVDDVDMLTTVIVGSSQTRMLKNREGKMHVYTPRGYAAKPGSLIKAKG